MGNQILKDAPQDGGNAMLGPTGAIGGRPTMAAQFLQGFVVNTVTGIGDVLKDVLLHPEQTAIDVGTDVGKLGQGVGGMIADYFKNPKASLEATGRDILDVIPGLNVAVDREGTERLGEDLFDGIKGATEGFFLGPSQEDWDSFHKDPTSFLEDPENFGKAFGFTAGVAMLASGVGKGVAYAARGAQRLVEVQAAYRMQQEALGTELREFRPVDLQTQNMFNASHNELEQWSGRNPASTSDRQVDAELLPLRSQAGKVSTDRVNLFGGQDIKDHMDQQNSLFGRFLEESQKKGGGSVVQSVTNPSIFLEATPFERMLIENSEANRQILAQTGLAGNSARLITRVGVEPLLSTENARNIETLRSQVEAGGLTLEQAKSFAVENKFMTQAEANVFPFPGNSLPFSSVTSPTLRNVRGALGLIKERSSLLYERAVGFVRKRLAFNPVYVRRFDEEIGHFKPGQARLDIYTKPLAGDFPLHVTLVYTDRNASQFFIRGGPSLLESLPTESSSNFRIRRFDTRKGQLIQSLGQFREEAEPLAQRVNALTEQIPANVRQMAERALPEIAPLNQFIDTATALARVPEKTREFLVPRLENSLIEIQRGQFVAGTIDHPSQYIRNLSMGDEATQKWIDMNRVVDNSFPEGLRRPIDELGVEKIQIPFNYNVFHQNSSSVVRTLINETGLMKSWSMSEVSLYEKNYPGFDNPFDLQSRELANLPSEYDQVLRYHPVSRFLHDLPYRKVGSLIFEQTARSGVGRGSRKTIEQFRAGEFDDTSVIPQPYTPIPLDHQSESLFDQSEAFRERFGIELLQKRKKRRER